MRFHIQPGAGGGVGFLSTYLGDCGVVELLLKHWAVVVDVI